MKKTKNQFPPEDETLLFHILHQEEKGSVKPTARQFNSVAVAMKSNDVSEKSDKQVASKMQYCNEANFKFSRMIYRNCFCKKEKL